MKTEHIEKIIRKAEMLYGDITFEYAEQNIEGGFESVSSGAVSLSEDDIKMLMGEAIMAYALNDPFGSIEKIVDYWYGQEYGETSHDIVAVIKEGAIWS